MAVKRIPILGAGTTLDTTGVSCVDRYDGFATNDVWKRLVLVFNNDDNAAPTIRHGFYGGFVVPKDYVGSPKIIVVWTSTKTSGDVVFDFDYRTVGGNDTTSLDQSGTEESVTVTDTAPGAAHRRLECSMSLTAANLSPDEEVEFYLARDGADAADTLAGSAIVFSVMLEYTDV